MQKRIQHTFSEGLVFNKVENSTFNFQTLKQEITIIIARRQPIDFEQCLQKLINQKLHCQTIISTTNIISKRDKLIIQNEIVNITNTNLKTIQDLQNMSNSKQNLNHHNIEDDAQNQLASDKMHDTNLDVLAKILQLQTETFAKIMIKLFVSPKNTNYQKLIHEQFIKIFLEPQYMDYGRINSDTILQQQCNRYKLNLEVNHLMDLNPCQWLSNQTIDFVCEYFMEKQFQGLNVKGLVGKQQREHPNLIIPYRIFDGYKDFPGLKYFSEIKIQYSIPESSSLFEAFHFIGIPININASHWVSIAIDSVDKKIHYFDSLRQPARKYSESNSQNNHIAHLKQLIEQYSPGTSSQYKTCSYLQATQQNGYDCGVFVLKFLQAMMKNEFNQDKLSFNQKQVTQFRKSLYYLIPMIAQDPSSQLDMVFMCEIEDGLHYDY